MGFRPNFLQCQLLLLGGVVALVMICTLSFTPDLDEQKFTPGECEGCHNSFVPLEMEVSVERVNDDWPAHILEVEVRNPDEHEIRDLRLAIADDNITVSGAGGGNESSSVTPFNTNGHAFEVPVNVNRLDIWLDGDEGVVGNDIDMEVTGPSGGTWISNGPEADEEVHINVDDLADEGPGEYRIEISWISGDPTLNVDYTLTVEFELGADNLTKSTRHLRHGRSMTYSWYLNLTPEQVDNLTLDAYCFAFYEHDGVGPDLEHYALAYKEGGVTKHEAKDFYKLGLGQALGIALLSLVVTSSISGLYAASRLSKPDWFALAPRRSRYRGHTLTSLLLLAMAIPHALTLQTGIYSGTSIGINSGLPTISALAALTIISLQQKSLSRRWGFQRWQWIHRGTIILFLFLLVSHIQKIATHL